MRPPKPLRPRPPAAGPARTPRAAPERNRQLTRSTGYPPERLVIPHDDQLGRLVGRTAAGQPFFIASHAIGGWKHRPGRQFVALYRFGPRGELQQAEIEEVGAETGAALEQRFLARLGAVQFGAIEIRLFRIERMGITFGLVPEPVDDEEDEDERDEYVFLQPGNHMAFVPPWDGSYET